MFSNVLRRRKFRSSFFRKFPVATRMIYHSPPNTGEEVQRRELYRHQSRNLEGKILSAQSSCIYSLYFDPNMRFCAQNKSTLGVITSNIPNKSGHCVKTSFYWLFLLVLKSERD